MMAGGIKSRRTLSLLILLIFLSLTELLEVKDEWQELRPDTAGLYRLRGQSEHMLHEGLPSDQRVDIGQSVQGHWQQCEEGFTSCGTQEEQHVDEQKISASEISHSYSRTLLVMTGKEKPAEDRVQQESSMDPHYSVTVSTERLFNGSCGPEADHGTVVEISGRVSEDGQAVSGLKAVLETTQENPQIYQVMTQPDSVPLDLTLPRPADHSTQYDHQQILIMQDDLTVRKAAASLYEKRPTVTSVYALDENQRPELIHGASVPLSEDSRLTLVGHGERDRSGETRLAGYTARDVARIIQHTFRTGDRIKTTSVVACEVGSDEEFAEALLRELHETANIETELHLRSAVLQVRHTGEIITQEISEEGVQWRQNDDSKKVVATLDRNGDVVIRNEPGSRGEQVFTHERNFLAKDKTKNQKNNHGQEASSSTTAAYRDNWPDEPRRFIDQKGFDMLTDAADKTALKELEALSWAFFHADLPLPEKVNTANVDINKNYVIGVNKIQDKKQSDRIKWITVQQELINVLSSCYEIITAQDVRSIIRHYAKEGENHFTHLMVTDWIYVVDPVSLYVYPVGKRLDQNQRNNQDNRKKVVDLIEDQTNKVRYEDLKVSQDKKERYATIVRQIFHGKETSLQLQELKYATYFTASVIAESARNFRTFPLILMAVNMAENPNEETKKKGRNFLCEEHSMATGGSWINPNLRGFSGSATPVSSEQTAYDKLKAVIEREVKLYNSWTNTIDGGELNAENVRAIAVEFELPEDELAKNYNDFKTEMNKKGVASSSGP
ncbi:unnamed protein product [Leuciscus chuanchicus]